MFCHVQLSQYPNIGVGKFDLKYFVYAFVQPEIICFSFHNEIQLNWTLQNYLFQFINFFQDQHQLTQTGLEYKSVLSEYTLFHTPSKPFCFSFTQHRSHQCFLLLLLVFNILVFHRLGGIPNIVDAVAQTIEFWTDELAKLILLTSWDFFNYCSEQNL